MNHVNTPITECDLINIYGTSKDLEHCCVSSSDCWKEIEEYMTHENQKPYLPYIGQQFKGIVFSGINLNGGNTTINAIDRLVGIATNKYLKFGKFKIFKSTGYGGSPFYYYIPLLSYLFNAYECGKTLMTNEHDISFKDIISGFNFCAVSNIIKCSVLSPDNRSTPSESMYRNCIGKFKKELNLLDYKVLVVFTLFKFPSLVSDNLEGFVVKNKGSRYRLSSNGYSVILELEHPLSTQITRDDKFISYSKAMYDTVQLIRTNGFPSQ